MQTSEFRGVTKQPLRNVLLYAPTIIWVNHGQKQLWWHDSTREYASDDWLVIPASHSLTFVNEPAQTAFHSRMLTLLAPPPAEWLESQPSHDVSVEPRVAVTPELAFCFNTLFSMPRQSMSTDAQHHLLMAFYAELKKHNALHLLFPGAETSVRERLASYLSVNPGDPHHIETVANHFSMSRHSQA